MAELITITDFNGDEFLQQDLNTSDWLDEIRTEYARPFVRQLLGAQLGNLFLTNWDAVGGDPNHLERIPI